jgi:hypothetical protein
LHATIVAIADDDDDSTPCYAHRSSRAAGSGAQV